MDKENPKTEEGSNNPPATPSQKPGLEDFDSLFDSLPKISPQWGLSESARPKLAGPPLRLVGVLLVLLVAAAILPFVLSSVRQDSVSQGSDDYYKTLEAYAQAKAKGGSLQMELSPTELSRLSSASRVEMKDGSYLVLGEGSTCWSIPVNPTLPPPSPKKLDSAYCRQ